MKTTRNILLGLTTAALTAGMVFAGSHTTPEGQAVAARHAHMDLYQFNLGILGNMAKGAVDFDEAVAMGAAKDLAALANMSQASYWIPGTSSTDIEGSRGPPPLQIWKTQSRNPWPSPKRQTPWQKPLALWTV